MADSAGFTYSNTPIEFPRGMMGGIRLVKSVLTYGDGDHVAGGFAVTAAGFKLNNIHSIIFAGVTDGFDVLMSAIYNQESGKICGVAIDDGLIMTTDTVTNCAFEVLVIGD